MRLSGPGFYQALRARRIQSRWYERAIPSLDGLLGIMEQSYNDDLVSDLSFLRDIIIQLIVEVASISYLFIHTTFPFLPILTLTLKPSENSSIRKPEPDALLQPALLFDTIARSFKYAYNGDISRYCEFAH